MPARSDERYAKTWWQALLMVCATLSLVGCAGVQEIGQRQVYAPPGETSTAPAPSTNVAPLTAPEAPPSNVTPLHPQATYPASIEQTDANVAVVALYRHAEQARKAGDFARASSDLERALRLAPSNAFVWSALAAVHLQAQEWSRVEGEASKSNSLAHGNPALLRVNWSAIATARKSMGNAAGALDAQQQADKYARLTSRR